MTWAWPTLTNARRQLQKYKIKSEEESRQWCEHISPVEFRQITGRKKSCLEWNFTLMRIATTHRKCMKNRKLIFSVAMWQQKEGKLRRTWRRMKWAQGPNVSSADMCWRFCQSLRWPTQLHLSSCFFWFGLQVLEPLRGKTVVSYCSDNEDTSLVLNVVAGKGFAVSSHGHCLRQKLASKLFSWPIWPTIAKGCSVTLEPTVPEKRVKGLDLGSHLPCPLCSGSGFPPRWKFVSKKDKV